jgi:hypothetical protein
LSQGLLTIFLVQSRKWSIGEISSYRLRFYYITGPPSDPLQLPRLASKFPTCIHTLTFISCFKIQGNLIPQEARSNQDTAHDLYVFHRWHGVMFFFCWHFLCSEKSKISRHYNQENERQETKQTFALPAHASKNSSIQPTSDPVPPLDRFFKPQEAISCASFYPTYVFSQGIITICLVQSRRWLIGEISSYRLRFYVTGSPSDLQFPRLASNLQLASYFDIYIVI